MNRYGIDEIYVEPSASGRELTRRVLSRLKGVPLFHAPVEEITSDGMSAREIDLSKKRLYIRDYRGEPLKPCPGTKGRLCCNYFVVNLAEGCPLNCSYCILQRYLNRPYLTLYANVDYFLEGMHARLKAAPGRVFRIGTGELTDSLALDPITGLSQTIVPFFAERDNGVLELKTKTAAVGNLLGLEHKGKTVIAWSLNPQSVIDGDEAGAAPLTERLKAASLCQEAGYRLAFHFDPLVHYGGWEADYRGVVEELFALIRPESISWISMGGLRFSPRMKPVMRERFPLSSLPLGELVPCEDGKLRYFKPIRLSMYRSLLSWIRGRSPELPVYLCMESLEVWRRVFGRTPPQDPTLIPLFHRGV
jgi:spore photoproduct lyase